MTTEDGPRRVAVVSGGGTGIGSAVADALLADGLDVTLLGRRADVLDRAVDALRDHRPGAAITACGATPATPPTRSAAPSCSPGATPPWTSSSPRPARPPGAAGGTDAATLKAGPEAAVPMKRYATADEIAATAASILSDEVPYVHGENITVGGGLTP